MVSVPTIYTVDRPRSHGYSVQVDDLLLRTANIAGQQIRVQSARAQAQQVNTSENPEEFISDVGRTFALSDATGGEGLLLRHRRRRTDADSTRYWDSRGVKIERPEQGRTASLCLLNDTEVIHTGSTVASPMVAFDGDLFVGNGTNVTVIDTPEGTPSTTSEAVGGGAVVGLAALGDRLFAATTSAIRVRTSGTWGAAAGSLAATAIWSAKDRLILAASEELDEWDGDAASLTTLYTLPSGESWVGAVDGPGAVYAAATNGFVYAFAPDDTGALALLGQTKFQSETPTCIGASQGLVFVGTDQAGIGRLWVMQAANGELTGAVVREWTLGTPYAIVADRENVYTVVGDGEGVHSTWRYDVVTGGLFRWWDFTADDTNDATSLALLAGNFYAAFDGAADTTVQRTASTLVSEGYLISPLADFYTAEAKTWVGGTLDVGDIPSGSRVELLYTTSTAAMTDPDGEWRLIASASSSTDTTFSIAGVEARQLAGMVRLYADTALTGCPEVESFSFRGLLASTDVLVELPINVSDWLEQPYKKPLRVPGLGSAVYAALKSKERANVYVELFRPSERIRGQMEAVETPVPQLSRRGSSLLVSLVTIRGRRVGAQGASQQSGPLGSFSLGSLPLGGAV